MNPYKLAIFLIIFNFMLTFFTSLGLYAGSSQVAVDSSQYSAFTTTNPSQLLGTIFSAAIIGGGAGIFLGTIFGGSANMNPLLTGAIGLMTGIILTTVINTFRVFNNIATLLGHPISDVMMGLIGISTIIFVFSTIWFVQQMIAGPQEFYS